MSELCSSLTLLSDQVTFTPVGAQGGFHGTPRENHFPTLVLQWNLHHICTGHKKLQFCKKKIKCCTVSKWRPNNRFLFRVISILAKFWKKKNTFPKEFFNEIWLKEGEYEQIYITEIKFLKNYSVSKWWPKQFFDIAQ